MTFPNPAAHTAIARPMPRPTAQVAVYVEVLGVDLAIDFLLTFGGAGLAVSQAPNGSSAYEALIGADKAKQLGAQAHRLAREVPLAKRWLAAMLHWQGRSKAEIARTLRVSQVSVRKWLKEAR